MPMVGLAVLRNREIYRDDFIYSVRTSSTGLACMSRLSESQVFRQFFEKATSERVELRR